MSLVMTEMVCTNCGSRGFPKAKGSLAVEIILWLLFIIPGLIYSVWRGFSKHTVCPKCGAQNMVPFESPRGQEILKGNKNPS
jgi:hypothetical protein